MNPFALLLVLCRTFGLGATAPVLSTPGLDMRGRFLLGILLTAVIAPVVGPPMQIPTSPSAIILTCLGELVIGSTLGLAAGLIIAGARQAGEVVGAQAGLSAAALFDPDAGEELTPLGHLYGLIAMGVFLALDGPLMLIRSLIQSYETLPVGELSLSLETIELAFERVAQALKLTVHAAAPVAIAMTLAGIALGLIGRAAASLPITTMSLPVRYVVGLTLAILGAVALAGTLQAAWGTWPSFGSHGG